MNHILRQYRVVYRHGAYQATCPTCGKQHTGGHWSPRNAALAADRCCGYMRSTAERAESEARIEQAPLAAFRGQA